MPSSGKRDGLEGVPAEVAAAVLAAALLHASWHALVKSSGDRIVALAGMNVVSGAVALALLPFVRPPTMGAAAVIAFSVLLHMGYKLALAQLYVKADLSHGYPLARGITPLVAAALGFAALGEAPSGWALAGIGAISAGILGLALERGARPLPGTALAAAAIAGTAVAGYSVVDAYGVRLNGDWLGFTAWLVAADSALFVGYALATRRAAATGLWRREWGRTLLSGALGVISFGVFMWALGRAQVGPVTALRETSIVFAALLGTWVLKEPANRLRYLSAALVTGGVAAIALSR
jgi:drug/metabolite transporter (DMT)-like permease